MTRWMKTALMSLTLFGGLSIGAASTAHAEDRCLRIANCFLVYNCSKLPAAKQKLLIDWFNANCY